MTTRFRGMSGDIRLNLKVPPLRLLRCAPVGIDTLAWRAKSRSL